MTTNFDKINMLYKNEHENSFIKSIMSLRSYYIVMIVRLNIVNLLIHNNMFIYISKDEQKRQMPPR